MEKSLRMSSANMATMVHVHVHVGACGCISTIIPYIVLLHVYMYIHVAHWASGCGST